LSPSIYKIYEDFIWRDQNLDLAENLYGTPPLTLDSLVDRVTSLLDSYKDMLWHIPEKLSILKKVLVGTNKKLGCLTPKVRESIESLENGAVESAHQTAVLGGPAYILNKATTASQVASLASDKGISLTPFFCMADYDTVQSELTHIRTPLMGKDGNIISIPIPQDFENSPVSVLPLPGNDWLRQVEEDIRNGYRPMFKNLERHARSLYEERLEQSLTVVKAAFINSETLGEWAQRIMGYLFNVIGNLGLPLLTASEREIRELLTEGMEFLLARDNRERFLRAHDEATTLIGAQGYNSGIGHRGSDYVPFFYECPEPGCNNSRTELHYENRGATAVLKGRCLSCSETIEIETPADNPYLGDIATQLSPRVDSRQILIDTLIPTVAHVGGPGETAYYAQVIPSARAMKIPFPMFVKYPRVYFNTPWNEQLAKSLEKEGFDVLHRKDMFSLLGKIAKFRKKKQFNEMNEQLVRLKQLILGTHSTLNESLQKTTKIIGESSGKKAESLQLQKLELERYLSWVFGQYTDSKLGQESSWSWIEWAINSGFSDLFGPYERAYVGPMKNGATVFVNFSV